MKKILAIVIGVLIILAGTMIYNVERAMHAPASVTPGPLEVGQQQLHLQLEQVKENENQIEKQNWNSAVQLRILLQAHQHRINELTGNRAAGEILAYDKDAVVKLEKRISELDALAAQQATEAAAQQASPSGSAVSPQQQ